MAGPLRLLVFDRTCPGRFGLPGLSQAWAAGRHFYGWLGRIDAAVGAGSWAEAIDWLAEAGAPERVAEIQYWGHGHAGRVWLAGEALEASALAAGHRHHAGLARVAGRMSPGAAGLWWFRTCETFGGPAGQGFARAWTRFFGCRAAGHTHRIGFWQSGLHSLLPDQDPGWPLDEGWPRRVDAADATPWPAATGACWSRPGLPNTISCLQGKIPPGF